MGDDSGSVEAAIVELEAEPSAAIRVRQAMAELDLGALFERNLPRVFGRLGELGAAPAGPPYGRYHAFGPELVDVEIGVPVPPPGADLAPLGRDPAEVGASELPGGEVARAVHYGPYTTLPQTYERLERWIRDQGREPGAAPWESYVDDPGAVADPARLRTFVVWPLA
jgi:effector-binding domain-containing protein